jgi:hypothetical protein
VRLTFAICIGLALSGIASGQAGNDPEQVVKQVIDTGLLDGHDQKVILRLGDAGAVLATKVLSDRELTSKTIGGALIVIESSFGGLKLVGADGDQQPRTALLLLRYLDLSTNDSTLKKQIAETSEYVRGQYAASLKALKK